MAESGREAILEGREWSAGHHGGSLGLPEGPGVVVRPSRRARSSWEALLDCR